MLRQLGKLQLLVSFHSTSSPPYLGFQSSREQRT